MFSGAHVIPVLMSCMHAYRILWQGRAARLCSNPGRQADSCSDVGERRVGRRSCLGAQSVLVACFSDAWSADTWAGRGGERMHSDRRRGGGWGD